MQNNVSILTLIVRLVELGDIEEEREGDDGCQIFDHPPFQGLSVVGGLTVVQRVVNRDISGEREKDKSQRCFLTVFVVFVDGFLLTGLYYIQ